MSPRTTSPVGSKPRVCARPDWNDPASFQRLMEILDPIARDGFATLVLHRRAADTAPIEGLEQAYARHFGTEGELEVTLADLDRRAEATTFDACVRLSVSDAHDAPTTLASAADVRSWRRALESSPEWLERVLARTEGMIDVAEARCLFELARSSTNAVVEVGSWRGRSTVALALGSRAGKSVPVYAIEPHETFVGILGGRFGPQDRRAFYRTMLDVGVWDVVRLVNVSSEVVASGWTQPIGLLWSTVITASAA